MVNAYTRGAVEVLYAGAVEVRSWYGPSTLVVRFRFASSSVRFVNFSTGDTVLVHVVEYNTKVLITFRFQTR